MIFFSPAVCHTIATNLNRNNGVPYLSADGWQMNANGLTEWFDGDANNISHMLWPSQSPDLNPVEHQWEFLEWCAIQRSIPPSSEHLLREYLLEEWYFKFSSTIPETCSRGAIFWWPNLLFMLFCYFSFNLSPFGTRLCHYISAMGDGNVTSYMIVNREHL